MNDDASSIVISGCKSPIQIYDEEHMNFYFEINDDNRDSDVRNIKRDQQQPQKSIQMPHKSMLQKAAVGNMKRSNLNNLTMMESKTIEK